MDNDTTAETPISIRLPKALLPKIDNLARKERRTRANYILVVLEEVVRRGGLAAQDEDSTKSGHNAKRDRT